MSLTDIALAIDATRRAGAVVMRYFGRDLAVEHKTPTQPLTEADLAADALLREMLTGARPGYGWLSEETLDSPDRLGRKRVWIVDPIDGTSSFIAKVPEFAISVGLVEDGEVIAGVIFNPARDELYHAVRGRGAHVSRAGRAAVPLRVSGRTADESLTILASRSEIAAGELDPFSDAWRIEPAGSTAYKLAGVAAGHGEAFVSRGPKSEWDICAGVLLVSEAGGLTTDLHGDAPRFNRDDPYVHGILSASSAVHGEVLRTIRRMPAGARQHDHPVDPLHPRLRKEE